MCVLNTEMIRRVSSIIRNEYDNETGQKRNNMNHLYIKKIYISDTRVCHVPYHVLNLSTSNINNTQFSEKKANF